MPCVTYWVASSRVRVSALCLNCREDTNNSSGSLNVVIRMCGGVTYWSKSAETERSRQSVGEAEQLRTVFRGLPSKATADRSPLGLRDVGRFSAGCSGQA